MITISLRELAISKGIENSYQLRKACPLLDTGKVMSKSIISILWKGVMKKIGLTTIEAVCVGLGCEASDWIIVTAPITTPAKAGGMANKEAKPRTRRVVQSAAKKTATKKIK
jgi:DNA-binding Xre family transcriptional regulator